MPRRAKNIKGLGETVIVDEATVDGEEAHEEDEITATLDRPKHLEKQTH